MQNSHHRLVVRNNISWCPRGCVRIPFNHSLPCIESKGQSAVSQARRGCCVGHDMSSREIRVSTEAVVKPGDLMAVTVYLPK